MLTGFVQFMFRPTWFDADPGDRRWRLWRNMLLHEVNMDDISAWQEAGYEIELRSNP